MSHPVGNDSTSQDRGATTASGEAVTGGETRTRTAGAFDIRVIIGTLLGIYGVILLLMDLLGDPQARVARANDIDLNLWTGLALLAVAAGFVAWARLRPIVIRETSGDEPPEAA